MGEFVKRQREKKPWTQEHLASAAELSVRTVQRAEEGAVMGAETLQALAGALGVSIEEIRRGSTDAEVKATSDAMKALKKDYVVVDLAEIRDGHQLGELVTASFAAAGFHVEDAVSKPARKLFAEMHESLVDWGDLWNEIPATQCLACEEEWTEILDRLRDEGCVVTAGVRPGTLGLSGSDKRVGWDVLYVIASPTAAPTLQIIERRRGTRESV